MNWLQVKELTKVLERWKMNRKDAIKGLKNIRNVPSMFINETIKDLVEALEKPLTLADLLGWEEGVEYESDGHRFKVKNDSLTILERNDDYWGDFDYSWDIKNINWLRQATKVEPKLKACHVKDEYSYNCLMEELEEQGYTWSGDTKATDVSYWGIYENDTVIHCERDKSLSFSDLAYFNSFDKNNYELVEYHKEEPKFYARIKGWELLRKKEAKGSDSGGKYFIYAPRANEITTIPQYNGINDEWIASMTKKEWNKLGINDTNANFEEVKE